jgi:hypothetical protein
MHPFSLEALDDLLQRARTGSQEAASTLYDLFSDHVQRVVRLHLNDRVRRVQGL